MKIKDIKYKMKYIFQKAKKGFCDEDLFSIHDWFIENFPKMLEEFAECTCGYPCDEEELKEEVNKFPGIWKLKQKPIIDKILKNYDSEFNLKDGMCCWILIILRMKYCFEKCSEWHEEYECFWKMKQYEYINNCVENYKKEGFYLFEKYFFNLWW